MRGFSVRVAALLAVLAVSAAASAQDSTYRKGSIPRFTADGIVNRPPVVATGGADIRPTPAGGYEVVPNGKVETTSDAIVKPYESSGRNTGWHEMRSQQREQGQFKLVLFGLALGLGLLVGFVRLLWAFAQPRPRVARLGEQRR